MRKGSKETHANKNPSGRRVFVRIELVGEEALTAAPCSIHCINSQKITSLYLTSS